MTRQDGWIAGERWRRVADNNEQQNEPRPKAERVSIEQATRRTAYAACCNKKYLESHTFYTAVNKTSRKLLTRISRLGGKDAGCWGFSFPLGLSYFRAFLSHATRIRSKLALTIVLFTNDFRETLPSSARHPCGHEKRYKTGITIFPWPTASPPAPCLLHHHLLPLPKEILKR